MKKGKIFYGWWVVLGSVLITTTMIPSVMAMANKFLIPVTSEMAISRSTFAFSNTILQGMGIFLSPMVTKRLATGNLKKMQSISILIFGIAFASYGLARTPYHHYLSSFVIGICYLYATVIPISLMINNWFVKKRGLAMSLAMAGIGLGGFIFSPLVTYWINHFGWRTAYFIFAAIILIVSLPVSIFILKKEPAQMGLTPYGAEETKGNQPAHAKTIQLSTKKSFAKPFFLLLIIGMVLNGIINSGAMGQFPPALEEGYSTAFAASIISLYSIIGVLGKLLLGWLNDRFGIVFSAIFGCSTFSASFICLLLGNGKPAAYAMAVCFGLGLAIGSMMPPLVTASIYNTKQYGEVYGYVSSATQIGMSLGSLVVASIFDLTGSYTLGWIILFTFTLTTMVSWIGAYKLSRKYCQQTKTAGIPVPIQQIKQTDTDYL